MDNTRERLKPAPVDISALRRRKAKARGGIVKTAARTVAALGVISVLGLGAKEAVDRGSVSGPVVGTVQNIGEGVQTALLRAIEEPLENRIGQPVEYLKPKPVVTSSILGSKEIPLGGVPVRSKPYQGEDSIIGWTREGNLVLEARPIYGTVYGGDDRNKLREEHRTYGLWWEVDDLPAYRRTKDSLVEDEDENGKQKRIRGVIAGNFVREPTPEELKTIR